MRLLIDMNLSPAWVDLLQREGWEAVHWSTIGNPKSTDAVILNFARDNGWVVFTHDLDFGALLAHTQSGKPSVFQIRAQDVTPEHLGPLALRTLQQFRTQLEAGALGSVDEARQRVRLLPLQS